VTILDRQKKYAELFRIRLGDQSGGQPRSLDGQIRITSPSKEVIEAFVATYGGRGRRWSDRNQFQVYLDQVRLPIMLLPGTPITQHYEQWGGSSCIVRCDGRTQQGGEPCACDPYARLCKPVTRLTVACPEVPIVGTGILTTRSEIATDEMAGALDLCRGILSQGRAVRATLRIDRLKGVGKAYNVPRLELEGLTFAELAELASAPDNELAPTEALALTEGE
jgi:hypothetical protein